MGAMFLIFNWYNTWRIL